GARRRRARSHRRPRRRLRGRPDRGARRRQRGPARRRRPEWRAPRGRRGAGGQRARADPAPAGPARMNAGPRDDAWRYPLFEALYGRRSRRVARGFAITEGPLAYASAATPLPLSETEEALLVAAGVGVSGTPLW